MRPLVFTQFKNNKKSDSELLKSEEKALHPALAETDSLDVPTITSQADKIPDKVTLPSAEQIERLGPIVQQSSSNKLK